MISRRVVFLDAGGVIVLPHRELVTNALRRAGIRVESGHVPRAHYRAVRLLDRDPQLAGGYLEAFCRAIAVPDDRLPEAFDALSRLGDRSRSGEILWSEPTPGALEAIEGLVRTGFAVSVVTNSDGHAAENLRDAGIVQTGPGPGVTIGDIVDSVVVGFEKPNPRIFEVALSRAGVTADEVVHVGDTVFADVAGAEAAGITPIHFDPSRACRAHDHRHVRSLLGLRQHIRPPRLQS